MKKLLIFSILLFLITACASTAPKSKEENLARNKFGMEVAELSAVNKTESGLSHGIEITNVYSFYPASKAGIVKGDIIISINDQTIFDLEAFKELLQSYKYTYGQVTLGISRNNEIQKIKVYLD
ncbi:MAG: PDZ domain-containing protein [Flavobacteriaceae bacterium]|nr:PDZ domain-containing protein [Flavobacteriaceae bacterium]